MSVKLDKEEREYREKYKEEVNKHKDTNINGYLSIIAGLIPSILMIYLYISTGGNFNENAGGAGWWLMIIFDMIIGIPLFIYSFAAALSSFYKNKVVSIIGIISAFSPVLLIIFYKIFSLIKVL